MKPRNLNGGLLYLKNAFENIILTKQSVLGFYISGCTTYEACIFAEKRMCNISLGLKLLICKTKIIILLIFAQDYVLMFKQFIASDLQTKKLYIHKYYLKQGGIEAQS